MGCPGIEAPGDRRLPQAKNHETVEPFYKRAPRVGVLSVGVKQKAAS
jgi:hypothetical protein